MGKEGVVQELILSGSDPLSSTLFFFLPVDFAAFHLHLPVIFSLLDTCKIINGDLLTWKKEEEEGLVDDLVKLA